MLRKGPQPRIDDASGTCRAAGTAHDQRSEGGFARTKTVDLSTSRPARGRLPPLVKIQSARVVRIRSARTLRHSLTIDLGHLPVEEVAGAPQGYCSVGGPQALRVGLALKKRTHLPVGRGVGLVDAELAGVVSYRGHRLGYREGAVPDPLKTGVVCCYRISALAHRASVL